LSDDEKQALARRAYSHAGSDCIARCERSGVTASTVEVNPIYDRKTRLMHQNFTTQLKRFPNGVSTWINNNNAELSKKWRIKKAT